MTIFNHYRERYDATQEEELSIQQYLELCKKDATVYASAAERILAAIGEPKLVDTSKDARQSRIFPIKLFNDTKYSKNFMAWTKPSAK